MCIWKGEPLAWTLKSDRFQAEEGYGSLSLPQLPRQISQMGCRKQQAFSSAVLESRVWHRVPSWLLGGLACRCLPCHCVLKWQREERTRESSCSQHEGLSSTPCTTQLPTTGSWAGMRTLRPMASTCVGKLKHPFCNMGRHKDNERNRGSGGMKSIKRNQRGQWGTCAMKCS